MTSNTSEQELPMPRQPLSPLAYGPHHVQDTRRRIAQHTVCACGDADCPGGCEVSAAGPPPDEREVDMQDWGHPEHHSRVGG